MSNRVLLAGLFHETHTFLDGTTPLEQFQIRRGEELFTARSDGSPLSGVIDVADAAGWELLPVIDLRAVPGPIVDDAVVECFWDAFREAAKREPSRGIDGIFLVLHGAMASHSFPDVEGEIVGRIRSLSGLGETPLCGVFDLHGNISRSMVERMQGLVVYRCNPHVDACAAAVDAAQLLVRMMNSGQRPVCVWEHPPVMWPPTGTGTDDEPMKSLEAKARAIERTDPEMAAVNVFGGFSFADTPDTGVSFSAVTFGDPETARRRLRELCDWTVAHRALGNVIDPSLDEIMPEVLERLNASERDVGPIVIVEPADNVGGGAPGDGTTVLRTLIEHHVDNAAVVINDPAAVSALSGKPIGSRVRLSIGGKGSRLTEGPLELEVELLSKSNGKFDLEDRNSHLASMHGIHVDMGPCAVVRTVENGEPASRRVEPAGPDGGHEARRSRGVRILLTSRKTPPFDLAQLRSQGIEPESCSVIGVKAAVAHRRAYEKIQSASFTVSTPGPCSSDLKTLPFQHVRRPVYPLDEI